MRISALLAFLAMILAPASAGASEALTQLSGPALTATTPADPAEGLPLPPRRPTDPRSGDGRPGERPAFSPDALPADGGDEPPAGKEGPAVLDIGEGCEAIMRRLARAAPLDPVGEGDCRVDAAYDVVGVGTRPSVAFVPSATLVCPMAVALANWLDGPVQEAARELLDRTVSGLWVAASHSCADRGGDPEERLSEHARADALDIAAFVLDDGAVVSIEADWSGDVGRSTFLRRVHGAACGHFTTVLGPEADEYHRDHFHLDLAERGTETAVRICE